MQCHLKEKSTVMYGASLKTPSIFNITDIPVLKFTYLATHAHHLINSLVVIKAVK